MCVETLRLNFYCRAVGFANVHLLPARAVDKMAFESFVDFS